MVEVWANQEYLLPLNGILTLLSGILPTGWIHDMVCIHAKHICVWLKTPSVLFCVDMDGALLTEFSLAHLPCSALSPPVAAIAALSLAAGNMYCQPGTGSGYHDGALLLYMLATSRCLRSIVHRQGISER